MGACLTSVGALFAVLVRLATATLTSTLTPAAPAVLIHRSSLPTHKESEARLAYAEDHKEQIAARMKRGLKPNVTRDTDWAARTIQKVARQRTATKHRLRRSTLHQRLVLEVTLLEGLRVIILSLGLFAVLMLILRSQGNIGARFGLRETYTDVFELGDVAEIATVPALQEYLKRLSTNVRSLQVLSSDYFKEEEGELKMLSGIEDFDEPVQLEVAGLMPRISPAFSLVAWVQRLSKNAHGYVVRKPLGSSEAESALSCYGWFVGPRPRLDFGAHDYGGLAAGGARQEKQESAEAEGEHWSDGRLHLEVVVVNQTAVSFYQDGELRSVAGIRRAVTDCSGKALLLGDTALRLGEVTYFARALSPTEISEVFFAGYTLEAIGAGKVPFTPAESEFDKLRSFQLSAAAAAQVSRDRIVTSAGRATAVSQAVSKAAGQAPPPARTRIHVARQPGCTRAWPSCHVVNDVMSTLATDEETGHAYYDLIPPSMRNGAGPRARMYSHGEEAYHYDPASFPRWNGQSVSFSMWVSADATGYLLTKSPDWDQVARCWTFHLEVNGLANIGGAETDGFQHVNLWALIPSDFPFSFDQSPALRHIVQVFDVERNSLRGYLDGELLEESVFPEAGSVARLDCPVTPRTYIGFNHRAPGSAFYKGDVQDMRMYVGTALSDAEVRALAMHEGGEAKRECKLNTEGTDTQYTDVNGNDCAWFQEARAEVPSICLDAQAQAECPVACGTFVPCFQPQPQSPPPVHQLWERVMHLVPNDGQTQVVCVREGLEAAVVEECRRLRSNRDPRSYPPPATFVLASWHGYVATERSQQTRRDVNVTDCEELERTLSPLCSFSPAGAWTRGFDAEVAASGAMTATLWFKVADDTTLIDGRLNPNIMLLSSVAPPVPVIAFYIRTSGLVFATVWGGCGSEDREDAAVGHEIATDRWVHLSVVFGSTAEDGKRRIMVAVDSVFGSDLSPWEWCVQSSGETVQAVVVSSEMLLSPIRFRAEALTPKQLQTAYYAQRPAMRHLRGPSVWDGARLEERIEYARPAFMSPGAMVAPPILLQTRGAPGPCVAAQGNAFLSALWQTAVRGSTCAPPYVCEPALLASPDALLQCSKGGRVEAYFGRPALRLSGERVFSEFLPSIVDATVLVRNGVQYRTTDFIDTVTSKVKVLLVAFSPQHSMVTTVAVTAVIGARVQASYELLHLSSVEGRQLWNFTALVVVAGVLISFNLAEILYHSVLHVRHRRERRRKERAARELHLQALREVKEHERTKMVESGLRTRSGLSHADLAPLAASRRGSVTHSTAKDPEAMEHTYKRLAAVKEARMLLLDLVVLVLFPLTFLAIRMWQARDSAQRLINTVGTGGLGAVPWASKEVALEVKMEAFFSALEDLEQQIHSEQKVNVVGFFVGLCLLLRCILATKVHPRIAVLVNTLGTATDDLWHFLLLFLLMFCGFAGLASISFGGERAEFATLSSSIETLFEMMLGEVPMTGNGGSSLKWTSDPLMVIFVVLFNFLIFFVMLNFIIAIIVEAYLNAKKVVENDETEQEFFTDCASAISVFVKGRLKGWPPHWRLAQAMKECVRHTVGVDNLQVFFPEHRREVLLSIVRHYEGFDFTTPELLAPETKDLSMREMVDEVVSEVELRTATLFNLPVLSAGDRVIRQNHLNAKHPRRTSSVAIPNDATPLNSNAIATNSHPPLPSAMAPARAEPSGGLPATIPPATPREVPGKTADRGAPEDGWPLLGNMTVGSPFTPEIQRGLASPSGWRDNTTAAPPFQPPSQLNGAAASASLGLSRYAPEWSP